MKGIIGGTLDWLTHPLDNTGTLTDWAMGLAVILVLAFLWATVIKQLIEA